MTEVKTRPWAKCWRSAWLDERSVALDMCATLLRQFLHQHVGLVDEDGTGWATTEDGEPIDTAHMAAVCKATPAQIAGALKRLVAARIVVESGGRWGTRGWRVSQEDPEAKRKREYRERMSRDSSGRDDGTVPGHVPSVSRDGDDQRSRGQRTEDRGAEQQEPRAEPLALTPDAPAPKPPRARRPDPSASPDVRRVWLAYQDLRIKLELSKPDGRPEAERPGPVPAQVRDITRAVSAAGGVDSFLLVLRRAAEDQLRQAERAGVSVRDNHEAASKHFVIVTLGRQAGRYLELSDLDQRRPATPARASPGRSRPAPPQNPGSLPPDVPSDFGDYEWKDET